MLYLLLAVVIVAAILIFLVRPPRVKNVRVESGSGRALLVEPG